jgi:hypothetical protein
VFSTPVGGAALLGLLFTLIVLYLLVAVIVDGIKKAGAGIRSWAKARRGGRRL